MSAQGVAGVVGQARDGGIPADIVAQFDIAIAAMNKCLKEAGAGAENIVKVQVFMTDITERPKINLRRIAYFGQQPAGLDAGRSESAGRSAHEEPAW